MTDKSELDQRIDLLDAEVRGWLPDVWSPDERFPAPVLSVGLKQLRPHNVQPELGFAVACAESTRRLRQVFTDDVLAELASTMYFNPHRWTRHSDYDFREHSVTQAIKHTLATVLCTLVPSGLDNHLAVHLRELFDNPPERYLMRYRSDGL